MTETVLKVGRLIDGTDAPPTERAFLRIRDGAIAEIGRWSDEVALRADEVIDLPAATAMPGLINAHSHYASQRLEVSAQQIWQWPEGLQVLRASQKARSEMALGVTSARDAGAKGTVSIVLKRAIQMGVVPGPRMVVCGQLICSTGGHGYYMGREVDGPDEMRKAVRETFKLGADFIKLIAGGGINVAGPHPVFPWENNVVADTQQMELTEDEIRVAVEEAHKIGRRVAAHAHGLASITAAVNAGVDSVEHGIFLDERQASRMAERGIALVPTLTGIQQYVEFGPKRNVAPFVIERAKRALDSLRNAIRLAAAAGVRIATGTDNSGEMRFEVEQLAEVALGPQRAIAAATRDAALVCGIDADAGTLELGKSADVLVVDGDPLAHLSDLRSVRLVLRAGARVSAPH